MTFVYIRVPPRFTVYFNSQSHTVIDVRQWNVCGDLGLGLFMLKGRKYQCHFKRKCGREAIKKQKIKMCKILVSYLKFMKTIFLEIFNLLMIKKNYTAVL